MSSAVTLLAFVLSLAPVAVHFTSAETPPPADQVAVFPDTPTGKCAAAFVEAFNTGDTARMRAFEEAFRAKSALKNRSIDDRLKQFEQLKRDWGRLRVDKIVSSGPSNLVALVHVAAKNELFEFEFVFEPAAPFGLDHIKIQGPVDAQTVQSSAEPLTPDQLRSTVEGIAGAMDQHYVFPEVGKQMAGAIREALSAGKYDRLTNARELADRLTTDLRDVCHDKHLRVTASALPNESDGGPMRRKGTVDDARRDNYGFRRVELLPGNVGYIKFDEFHPSDEAKEVAAGAMAFLAHCDALIFDLRENGGGSPEMIRYLSNYLFDRPTHLNNFYDRSANKTEEWWTEASIPGRRFPSDLPVYVLTSHYTFSGAEEFAYNLLNLKRATLIGETTGGGAHPVRPIAINSRFSMMVPFARAVNPITNTNWEGVGVKPHIEVRADEALSRAQDEAAKAIEQRRSAAKKSS